MMKKEQPIGIFDSGVGGTSIWREINKLMPLESTIYLADSKNAPYGQKSKNDILQLSIKNTEKLIEMGAKIIVVACNTATTNAISELRKNYDIPIVGIEPAIKPAAILTKTKKIGILATKGTLNSELFSKTSDLYAQNIQTIEIVGEGLVSLIENHQIASREVHELLVKYLEPMIKANIDYLVLGCSHYPYLIPVIQKILPKNVIIIDSGEAVARQTKTLLESKKLLKKRSFPTYYHFYSNLNTKTLQSLLLPLPINGKIFLLDF